MLETTYVTPEVAAEMLGTSVEMLLLAGAEGRIQFYGLVYGLSEVEVTEYVPAEDVIKTKVKLLHFNFLPLTAGNVADVIRTGTTKASTFFSRGNKQFEEPPAIIKLPPPKTLSFHRHCIYVLRDDIQAIIDSKQTPPAGSVPSEEAVMQLSSQKSRAANNDSRILAAVLKHASLDPGKRGLAKQIAYWTEQIGEAVSEDTVRDRLEKVKELLDKKPNQAAPPSS